MPTSLRTLISSLIALVAVLSPGADASEATSLGPPFNAMEHTEYCSRYNVVDVCNPLGTADTASGSIGAEVVLSAPNAGAAPGRGSGTATATLDTGHVAPPTWVGVRYTFHVLVREATLERTGTAYRPGSPLVGDGEAHMVFQVRPHECGGCARIVTIPLVDESRGKSRLTNIRYALPVTIYDCGTEDPIGSVWVRSSVVVNQTLGFGRTAVVPDDVESWFWGVGDQPTPLADTGSSVARVSALIERIEVAEADPSACEPVGP